MPHCRAMFVPDDAPLLEAELSHLQGRAEDLLAEVEELLRELHGSGVAVARRQSVVTLANALAATISAPYGLPTLVKLLPTPEECTTAVCEEVIAAR